ncbi:MAG: polysaccharide deacetylase family protein [Archangium sp.]|nr:polysaccharide deacetylase family protein [Archangium sp.]
MKRVVLSLDFELRWGVADVLGEDLSAYRRNLEGVEEVVPRLLELFGHHGVRATWATVGALACESWDEYRARAPVGPRYLDPKFAQSPRMPSLDPSGRLHFAPHLVRSIANAKGQELASHSFSHHLHGEAGVQQLDVERDAAAVKKIFSEKFGVTPVSWVFPRNQVSFTPTLAKHGFIAWRTNPDSAIWKIPIELREWAPARALRFSESFVGVHAARVAPPEVQASSFIRLNLPGPAQTLHFEALARALREVRDGEVLHLWLHPHNLGDDPARRVGLMAQLFERLSKAAGGSIDFATMGEVARA